MKTFEIKAYAKVNLLLDVLNKRKDNYHNIYTVFQSVGIYDKITIKESKEFSLKLDNKNIPVNESNTIVKAYNIFKNAYNGKWQEFEILLNKNVPIGSGLGGGSADGAAILRFLNEYYKKPFKKKQLSEMAYKVGADVVFLLRGGTAIGKGRGEKLRFVKYNEVDDLRIVIVYPNIHISTKWAYENLKKYLTKHENSYNIINPNIDYGKFLRSLKNSFNVFEKLIYEYYPRISEIKKKLETYDPILSMMTGSGSSVFAIFDREVEIQNIEKQFSGNAVFYTTLLTEKTINRNYLTTM